jgi:hypothetical protein
LGVSKWDTPYFSRQSQRAYNWLMRDVQEVLSRLGHSPFRSRIQLRDKELDYLRRKGTREVLEHAAEFIEKRLAPAFPVNDGKQTPWRNHPVFVAQHATATCCRECLQKWHQIPKGKALTAEDQGYIVEVIGAWLSQQERGATEKRSVQGEDVPDE